MFQIGQKITVEGKKSVKSRTVFQKNYEILAVNDRFLTVTNGRYKETVNFGDVDTGLISIRGCDMPKGVRLGIETEDLIKIAKDSGNRVRCIDNIVCRYQVDKKQAQNLYAKRGLSKYLGLRDSEDPSDFETKACKTKECFTDKAKEEWGEIQIFQPEIMKPAPKLLKPVFQSTIEQFLTYKIIDNKAHICHTSFGIDITEVWTKEEIATFILELGELLENLG